MRSTRPPPKIVETFGYIYVAFCVTVYPVLCVPFDGDEHGKFRKKLKGSHVYRKSWTNLNLPSFHATGDVVETFSWGYRLIRTKFHMGLQLGPTKLGKTEDRENAFLQLTTSRISSHIR